MGQLRNSTDWHRVAMPLHTLEDLAHALAGAGGVFGFFAVSAAAARVERLAERWRTKPPEKLTSRRVALLARAADSLIDALRAVNEAEPPAEDRRPQE